MVDVDGEWVGKGQKCTLGIVRDPDVEFKVGLASLINGALGKVPIDVQIALPTASEGKGRHRNDNFAKPVEEDATCAGGGGDSICTGGGRTSSHNNGHLVPPSKPDDLGDGEAAHPQAAGRSQVTDAVKATHSP